MIMSDLCAIVLPCDRTAVTALDALAGISLKTFNAISLDETAGI
jgi:hypothetical protein